MKSFLLCLGLVVFQLGQAQEKELAEYFPVKLFFANDEPNPRTNKTTTELSYSQAYKSYQAQFDTYLNNGEQFSYLLDGDIEPNYERLKSLIQPLLDSLNAGNRIILTVKGFASPLHFSDYNVNISKRRINSFKNELMSNPELNKYIESKQLILEELPFGEYSAHKTVSDLLDSTHLSVHHMQASYERRVEVDLTSVLDKSEAFIYSENAFIDARKIKRGKKVELSFQIQNLGLEKLNIDQVAVSCGCSVAGTELKELLLGEKTVLNIEIDTKELALGKQVKSITIIYNNGQSKRFIVLVDIKS